MLLCCAFFGPIWVCFRLDARLQTERLDRCERRVLRTLHLYENVQRAGTLHLPHRRFAPCPLHAVVLAPITREASCADLLYNLPIQLVNTTVRFGPETPLLDVLDHPKASCGLQYAAASGKDISPTLHSHVNRLLDRVATLARVEQQLTSHSFHRSGVQHANSCAQLAARWISNRAA